MNVNKEQFVQNLKKLNKEWSKKLVVTKREKIEQHFWLFLAKIFSKMYTKSFSFDSNKWISKFKELEKKDKQRLRNSKGIEKKKIECWIKMHAIAVDELISFKKFQKINPLKKQYKEAFNKNPNFNNAKSYIELIKKEGKVMRKVGVCLKKKAEYQNNLIKLVKEQRNLDQFNVGEAVLTDIFVIYLTETKVPITTLVRIIYKFGIVTWTEIKNEVLLTKKIDELGNKLLSWDKIIEKDLKKFNM